MLELTLRLRLGLRQRLGFRLEFRLRGRVKLRASGGGRVTSNLDRGRTSGVLGGPPKRLRSLGR